MRNPTLFNKADSLLELRHDKVDLGRINERIQSLLKQIGPSPQDYLNQTVARACLDVLGADGVGANVVGAENLHFTVREHVADEIDRLGDEDLPRYLFYRYRYDLYPRMKRVDSFPPCLQVEPTSVCNYRCVFCYQTDTNLTATRTGQMGTMELDLFKRVIDQAEGECEAITLASRGEPLACKDIIKMLDYLRGKFLGLKINTNASLLDEEKAHAILQSGANTLVFSADAAGEPLYSQLRVNGRFDRVVRNVKMFQEIRSNKYPRSKLITRVSGVRYSQSQDLETMVKFWGDLVDQVAFVDYNPWENTYQRPINELETPCSDLWRRMFVWWDGTVNPCDVDYLSTLSVGDAKNTGISTIWRGDKYTAYREAHLARRRNSLSPCSRCTVV